MYVKDLIYRESTPSSVSENELDVLDDDNGDPVWEDEQEIWAWDAYVADIGEDLSHSPISFSTWCKPSVYFGNGTFNTFLNSQHTTPIHHMFY